jgi:8-oxo-dGTP pyrophosphatase MutT (NUDIX family)
VTRGLDLALQAALHPLAQPPAGTAWNAFELDGLLPPGSPREAAVLVGLIEAAGGPEVLLTLRSVGLREHGGQVSFPGGRIETGDASPAHAALREAAEEVGLQASQAQLLGYLDPLLTISHFRVLPVVTRIDPGFQPRPDPAEVAEVFRVPLEVLMDPAMLERTRIHFGGRERHVFQYRYQPQRIWGVTASILYNLRERLARVAGEAL